MAGRRRPGRRSSTSGSAPRNVADPRRLAVDRRPLGLRQPAPRARPRSQPALLRPRASRCPATAPPTITHLADPAGRARDQRPARQRQQRLGLLLQRQRVGVEGRQQADGRSTGSMVASSRRPRVRTQHLRAVDATSSTTRSPSSAMGLRSGAPPWTPHQRASSPFELPGNARELALDDGADRVRRWAPASRGRASRRGSTKVTLRPSSGPKHRKPRLAAGLRNVPQLQVTRSAKAWSPSCVARASPSAARVIGVSLRTSPIPSWSASISSRVTSK